MPMRCGWKSSPLLIIFFFWLYLHFGSLRSKERGSGHSPARTHAYTHMSTPGRIRRFYGNRVHHFRFPKIVIGRSHTQQPTR